MMFALSGLVYGIIKNAETQINEQSKIIAPMLNSYVEKQEKYFAEKGSFGDFNAINFHEESFYKNIWFSSSEN